MFWSELRDVSSAKNEEKGCPDQYRLIADSFSEYHSCEYEMDYDEDAERYNPKKEGYFPKKSI